MNISKALSKQGELLITLSDFLESAPPDEIELLGDVLVSWSQETSRSKDGNRLLKVLQQVIEERDRSDEDAAQEQAPEGHDASNQPGEVSPEAHMTAEAGGGH